MVNQDVIYDDIELLENHRDLILASDRELMSTRRQQFDGKAKTKYRRAANKIQQAINLYNEVMDELDELLG